MKKFKAAIVAFSKIVRLIGRTFVSHVRFPCNDIGVNTAISSDSVLATGTRVGCDCVLSSVRLGRYSYCVNRVSMSNVEVGAFTSIASNVKIGLFEHPTKGYISTFPGFHFLWKATPFLDRPKPFAVQRKTYIGNDVWLGDSAIVLSGRKIGNGAIVAAGAVVTKDVPPYAVVGGIPARIMRFRYDEQKIRLLESIKWWNWGEGRLRECQELFGNEESFFNRFSIH